MVWTREVFSGKYRASSTGFEAAFTSSSLLHDESEAATAATAGHIDKRARNFCRPVKSPRAGR